MSLEQPQGYEERRDSIRAKRIVTVRHRLHKHKSKKKAKASAWQISMTENMSYSGLLFVSAIGYEAKDIIELEVVMSGLLDIFKGYGEVIRQTKQKGGFFYIAVKYVNFKPSVKNRSAKKI